MKLSKEDLAFYNENGYFVVERAVPEEVCKKLSDASDAVAGEQNIPIQSIHRKSKPFHDVLISKEVLEPLDSLRNQRKIPINTTFVFAKPQNKFENGSRPHQDWPGPKGPVDSYIVVGLAIEGADESNGALIAFPGSHKLGILPAADISVFAEYEKDPSKGIPPLGRWCEVPAGLKEVQLSYPVGSLLIMHALLVHYSHKNNHPTRWRRHLYMDFIEDGDPFWPGWKSQRALVERPPYYS